MKMMLNMLCLFSFLMYAQYPESRLNQITVNANVEVKQKADAARFTFTVTTMGSSLNEAVEKAAISSEKIREKILMLGVKPGYITTSDFISGQNPGPKAFLSSSKDFRARVVTKVKVDSLAVLPSIFLLLSHEEVEEVSEIEYFQKDPAAIKSQARTEAAKLARLKAEEIILPLGGKLGKPLIIDEIRSSQYAQKYYDQQNSNTFNSVINLSPQSEDAENIIGSDFFSQTISNTCSLRVTFEIK